MKWDTHLGQNIVGWLIVLFGVALLIGSLTLLLIVTTQEASAGSWTPMKRIGKWNKPPPVVLCDATHVERENLKLVMNWWEDLGYKFGPLVTDESHRGCSGNVGGTITIIRSKVPNKAQTRFLEEGQKLQWAKIFLPNEPTSLMLAHELGHAMGWTHSDSPGHIMHYSIDKAGWFSAGLRIGYNKSFPGARGPRRGSPGIGVSR